MSGYTVGRHSGHALSGRQLAELYALEPTRNITSPADLGTKLHKPLVAHAQYDKLSSLNMLCVIQISTMFACLPVFMVLQMKKCQWYASERALLYGTRIPDLAQSYLTA